MGRERSSIFFKDPYATGVANQKRQQIKKREKKKLPGRREKRQRNLQTISHETQLNGARG